MKIDRLPPLLLQGENLHCRPVDSGPIVQAQIIPADKESTTPTFEVVIVCPARRPASKCNSRIEASDQDTHCHYCRGDSRGDYQIIGPEIDQQSDRGWV